MMDILIALNLASLLIVFLCGLLHCAQHYRCRCCLKSKYHRTFLVNTRDSKTFDDRSRAVVLRKQPSITTTNGPPKRHQRSSSSMLDLRFRTSMSSLRGSLQFAFSGKQRQCRFCLFGVERDFDFFPAAFSLFIVSVLFVLCLVATRSLFIHRHLLWIGSGSTNGLQLVMDIDDMIWSSLRRQWSSWTECSSFTVHRGDGVLQCILDWILAHCVMLLAVWESLFNFYRHFTTM